MAANAMLDTIFFDAPSVRLRERATVVAIVAALHFAVLAAWLMRPPAAPLSAREMEVSVTFAPAAVHSEKRPLGLPAKVTPIQPMLDETVEPAQLPAVPDAQQSNVPVVATAPAANPVEVSQPEVEPDYKASYLNNHLTYPLAARRMGIQGRVVLNVEVLAEGVSGEVKVHQSSGYEVLDRAALESVKGWRFVPASRAGQPFTKRFLIPIQFLLKDSEA